MAYTLAVIRGDGIGPEIVNEAVRALKRVGEVYGQTFRFEDVFMGGCAIDRFGSCLPEETLAAARSADAVLLGAVGGPKWERVDKSNRPEKGLLRLRAGLGLYANLRPATVLPLLLDASPLRADIARKGIDLLIVRELIGGIYFGEHRTETIKGETVATDTMRYSESEIRRIAQTAFEAARKRRLRVTSVDKSNVLDCSRLWKQVITEVAADYPDVTLEHMLVDNCAMQLVKDPSQFDVIVTENMFGDILSDEASMITGSIGMIPSASLGAGGKGLFEPIHGSAPDLAGKDLANPIGTILSAAMLLRYSLGLTDAADAVERAVNAALQKGLRTADIARPGEKIAGCREMGAFIAQSIV